MEQDLQAITNAVGQSAESMYVEYNRLHITALCLLVQAVRDLNATVRSLYMVMTEMNTRRG